MKAKTKPVQTLFLKALSGAGYLTWALQLLLLFAVYFQSVKETSIGKVVFPEINNVRVPINEPAVNTGITMPTSGPFTVIFAVVGIIFVLFAIYLVVMRYIPAVNKTAEKVVVEVAKKAVQQTERHNKKKIPVRKRRILSARISWWLKITISLVPLVFVLLIEGSPLIPKQIALLIMSTLSLWAILCFAAHAMLAMHFRSSGTN